MLADTGTSSVRQTDLYQQLVQVGAFHQSAPRRAVSDSTWSYSPISRDVRVCAGQIGGKQLTPTRQDHRRLARQSGLHT
jgi:hypothetical protein